MRAHPSVFVLIAAAFVACLSACALPESAGTGAGAPSIEESARPADGRAPNPLRNAYFGDLHIHTAYSYDAFFFAARATPDDAYRYCRGDAIEHPSGYSVQLDIGALDFCAVTDHAGFLGVARAMADPDHPLSATPGADEIMSATTPSQRKSVFQQGSRLLHSVPAPQRNEVQRSAWQEIIAAAERHYEPGDFTTFIGYEFTSAPSSQNLHRNVIFEGNRAPETPFSRLDSENPEHLWDWLDALRADGIEALAIPHNSNGSNGQMFRLETFDGRPLDGAYAETRMRNEPLVEVTQVKGTSETHPMLSPNDEWADFEIYPNRIGTNLVSEPSGGYVREAYLGGLLLEEKRDLNPFRFGLIGSSDTHNAAATIEEDDYFGKVGVVDGEPALRGSVPLDGPREPNPLQRTFIDDAGRKYVDDVRVARFGASGLAGVWAEENTREAIYAALRRKETFATSGPRIRIRFFAGSALESDLIDDPEAVEKAYRSGVPMGGDLLLEADYEPRFLAWAARDPRSAPLQRLQIVKGWVEDGEARERVFDVTCSDDLVPDPRTHRCPDNGATVDLSDCSISSDLGASELSTVWEDPDFDASQRAFYYLRVLENPSCRWSTWDAIRAGFEPRPDLPPTLQERAWSSPVWHVPLAEERAP